MHLDGCLLQLEKGKLFSMWTVSLGSQESKAVGPELFTLHHIVKVFYSHLLPWSTLLLLRLRGFSSGKRSWFICEPGTTGNLGNPEKLDANYYQQSQF
ncbi:unnamed protein product [Arctogadus glacialis]